MKTTRLIRFWPGCQGLPSPSPLLPNWSIMCTPWNTNLREWEGQVHGGPVDASNSSSGSSSSGSRSLGSAEHSHRGGRC